MQHKRTTFCSQIISKQSVFEVFPPQFLGPSFLIIFNRLSCISALGAGVAGLLTADMSTAL